MKPVICLVVVITLFGCGKEDGVTTSETDAITIKSPNVTAEESRQNMEKANIPPEAKKVLGGAMKGS